MADGLTPAEIAYDARGNLTRLADMVFTYDSANRHAGSTYDEGTSVALARDATGRIVTRPTDPAGAPPPVTTKYVHADGSDAAFGVSHPGVSGERFAGVSPLVRGVW